MVRSILEFQSFLLLWYDKNARQLPWRQTTDPYAILVSEIMLQQTQVSRVIEKYHQFMALFPTMEHVAQASRSTLLSCWSGLGYNSRALRLQQALQQIVCSGSFPITIEELEQLPGIGPYTARSVLIFAYNIDVATVDTNIRRIFIHEFGLPEIISKKELFTFAQSCLVVGRSRDWHNALMDYGSLVLTSKKSGIKPMSRQSAFKGSIRQYRGEIIRRLSVGERLYVTTLSDEWKKEVQWVEDIVLQMQQEGLVCCEDEEIYL